MTIHHNNNNNNGTKKHRSQPCTEHDLIIYYCACLRSRLLINICLGKLENQKPNGIFTCLFFLNIHFWSFFVSLENDLINTRNKFIMNMLYNIHHMYHTINLYEVIK